MEKNMDEETDETEQQPKQKVAKVDKIVILEEEMTEVKTTIKNVMEEMNEVKAALKGDTDKAGLLYSRYIGKEDELEFLENQMTSLNNRLTSLRNNLVELRKKENLFLKRLERASRGSQFGRDDTVEADELFTPQRPENTVRAWAIKATIKEKDSTLPPRFRSNLAKKLEQLKGEGVYACGSCERDGRNTTINFLVVDYTHRMRISHAVLDIARRLNMDGHLESSLEEIEQELNAGSNGIFVATAEYHASKVWAYVRKPGSIDDTWIESNFVLSDVPKSKYELPPRFPSRPSEGPTPSKSSVDGAQETHVLWRATNTSFKEIFVNILVQELGLSEETAKEELAPLLELTWDCKMRDHHNYDQRMFYFKWLFMQSDPEGSLWTLDALPVFPDSREIYGEPPSLLCIQVLNADIIKLHRALALRKFLTIYRTCGKVCLDHFRTEWSGTKKHSECWTAESNAQSA